MLLQLLVLMLAHPGIVALNVGVLQLMHPDAASELGQVMELVPLCGSHSNLLVGSSLVQGLLLDGLPGLGQPLLLKVHQCPLLAKHLSLSLVNGRFLLRRQKRRA